jgi:putative hydrolase of the HAD superfamily
MIKLIAFDFWETLATKRNPFFHFLDNIKKEFNVKFSKEEISDIYKKTMQTKYWESEADAFSELLRKLNIPVKKENILKIINIRNKSDSGILIFDFVVPLLKKLKENGYKIAIVSNTSMFTYQYIKKNTNVLKYIDYEIFSFQVGYSKPNPQIFLELQRRVNLYNNEILMIGDSFENDFKAPKILGINAILFKNYDQLIEEFKKYNISL